ncbi:unnamed protein product, partial [Strongylus vulgaris]
MSSVCCILSEYFISVEHADCDNAFFYLKSGNADNLSGAYLFLPDGEAKEIPAVEQDFVFPSSFMHIMLITFIRRRISKLNGKDENVVDGPIMKRSYVAGPPDLEILHVYSIAQGSPSIEITNEVDIRSKTNYELAMRLETSVESGDDLFTDLNGLQYFPADQFRYYHLLQLIRRKRMLDKLPLQAHFYPMPASAHIEDSTTRLSLLGNQALGVASLKSGQLEVVLDRRLAQDDGRGVEQVVLDRRLAQDDGRGVEQGVLDNHRTLSRFRLLVEPLSPANDVNLDEERIGFYSVVGLAQSMELHYPTLRMISK